MATARETLAAMRKQKRVAAPAAQPAPVDDSVAREAEARLRSRGTSGAEVKRRVAAGQSPDVRLYEEPTPYEAVASSVSALAAGAGRGLATVITVPADVASDMYSLGPVRRGARATLKMIRGEKVQKEEMLPSWPRTEIANAAAADANRAFNETLGVRPNIVNDVAESGYGLLGEVLAPGPEVAVEIRSAMKPKLPRLPDRAFRVSDELVDTATVSDDEIARLTEQAGRAQEAARLPPEPHPATLTAEQAIDQIHATETARRQQGLPTTQVRPDPVKYQRERLIAHDDEVRLAEEALVEAEAQVSARMRNVHVTQNGKRPRNAVSVEGETAEFMSPRAAEDLERSLRDEFVAPARRQLDDARAYRERFYRSLTEDAAPDRIGSPEIDDAPPPAGTPPPSAPVGSGGATGPEGLPKYARPSAINLERLEAPPEAKQFIADTAKAVDDPVGGNIAAELEALKGAPLTHAEIQAAKGRASVLTHPVTREVTERYAAELLRSRDELVAMARTGRVTPEYLELQRAVSTEATHLGRMLNSLGIRAGDDATATAIREVTEQLEAAGKTADEIVHELEGVNFADPAQAQQAYAKIVKPKWQDLLDAYRYTNLLSSPRTHIVNLASNLIQAGVTRPLDLLASGAVDWFGSKLTGRARTRYASDVAPYTRGMMNAYPKAVGAFMDAMRGKVPVGQLDLAQTAARSNVPVALQIVPRLLDGMDRFTVALIEGGEFERLASIAKKSGKPFNEAAAAQDAMGTAKEYAFRKPLDPDNASGHGAMLSTIDQFTSRVSHVLNTKVGGVQPLRWAVPFIQTPMNIFKLGLEHSPVGFATLAKSTRKTEQLGRAITGSGVFMGAGFLAMDDRTTWAVPRDRKGRAAFYSAGYQPYAVKIGDTWVSYTKLGPLAYPIAMAAAMKHEAQDNPEASGRMDVALAGRMIGALGEFFTDQSYMQGIGDIVNAAKGDESVVARTVSNFASQLVPLSSLQRWVTQIIDPVYRKSSRELSFEGLMQNLKRNMPGLSYGVPAQMTPDDEESKRQMPIVNAISPFGVSVEDPTGVADFEDLMTQRREAAVEHAQESGVSRTPDTHPDSFTERERAEWSTIERALHENVNWLSTTHPARVLPPNLSAAGQAAVGMPYPRGNREVLGGAAGRYGVPFSPEQAAQADATGKEANNILLGSDNPLVQYHETGHSAWQNSLTDEQRAGWKKHFRGLLTSARAIESHISALDEAYPSQGEDESDEAFEKRTGMVWGQWDRLPQRVKAAVPLWLRTSTHGQPLYEDYDDEAFAEAFGWYVTAPSLLRQRDPLTYRWMGVNVFKGREYILPKE